MKHILIVTALSQELKAIKSEIQKFQIPDVKISYFSSGMGNYNMILHLTKFLEHNNFDFVINIGICGYTHEKTNYFEVARIFNLANKKESLVPILLHFGKLGSLACSEQIVLDTKEIGEENFVDMESYGFEMVCDNFSLPRSIFKIPVDKIGKETINFDFEKAAENLGKNLDYKKLIERVLQYLEKNKKKTEEFAVYFSHWNFTFSEKEIFKKLHARHLSLVGEDFESFFLRNKQKNKKDFLKCWKILLEKYLIR